MNLVVACELLVLHVRFRSLTKDGTQVLRHCYVSSATDHQGGPRTEVLGRKPVKCCFISVINLGCIKLPFLCNKIEAM